MTNLSLKIKKKTLVKLTMQNQASNTTGNITDINIDHIKYKGTAIRDRENIPPKCL